MELMLLKFPGITVPLTTTRVSWTGELGSVGLPTADPSFAGPPVGESRLAVRRPATARDAVLSATGMGVVFVGRVSAGERETGAWLGKIPPTALITRTASTTQGTGLLAAMKPVDDSRPRALVLTLRGLRTYRLSHPEKAP